MSTLMMGIGIKSDDDSCIYDIKSANKQHMVEKTL